MREHYPTRKIFILRSIFVIFAIGVSESYLNSALIDPSSLVSPVKHYAEIRTSALKITDVSASVSRSWDSSSTRENVGRNRIIQDRKLGSGVLGVYAGV